MTNKNIYFPKNKTRGKVMSLQGWEKGTNNQNGVGKEVWILVNILSSCWSKNTFQEVLGKEKHCQTKQDNALI